MAKDTKYSCIEKFGENNSWNFKEYNSSCVLWKGSNTKNYFAFWSSGVYKRYVDDSVSATGTWVCDGESNFIITTTDYIYYSSDGFKRRDKTDDPTSTGTDTPAQLDPEFSCVINGLTSMAIGESFQIKDNLYVVVTWGDGSFWYFYKTKPGVRPWVEVDNNKTIKSNGTWSCLGESNFQLTRSDGKTYVGGDSDWKEDTQAEPTYDKSKFPLKLDSRGPEVAQLQNYLNKLIPFEPLVVNGIFNKKTQDKLIQLQKNLPI
jgi:hypothetical protein